jgi:hypothetical protein
MHIQLGSFEPAAVILIEDTVEAEVTEVTGRKYGGSPTFQSSEPCQLHRNDPEILCSGIQICGNVLFVGGVI